MDKYNLENEIKTLQKHYNDAEKAIKIVEILRLEGVAIPAVTCAITIATILLSLLFNLI